MMRGANDAAMDTTTLTAFERLLQDKNEGGLDAQKDLLRCLARADAPDTQREALHAMESHEFVQYLQLRRDRRREDVERISERRSQSRARGREKWRGVSEQAATVEDVRRLFPGLFQQEPPTMNKKRPNHLQPSQAERVNGVSSAPTAALTRPPLGTAPQLNRSTVDNHAAPLRPSPSPSPPVQQGVEPPRGQQQPSAPLRTLSELLKRKTDHVADDEEDEPMVYPHYRPQHRSEPPAGRNPFQTAGDKLQRDRVHGKHTMEDDDNEINDRIRRNGRGLARQAPRGGGYHPINPNLLLGGGGVSDEYDPDDDIGGGDVIRKKFVSPVVKPGEDKKSGRPHGQQPKPTGSAPAEEDEDIDPRLKSCDPELIAKIEMEIVDNGDPVTFEDIAGLQFAKKCVNELVIWPMARPDIFTGLRAIPKGLLLFGPPGTGKTLIGKAIASQSGATFFSISASSLTSKWIGEGEKLVRTLFAVAAVKQPSVIFIDEIDSLLTQRSSEENEASRRMKTEFLVQLDGAGTKAKDVILVVGATNRPQELDEAARRRFVKRLYIPLPSYEARHVLISRLLKGNNHDLSADDLKYMAEKTSGYSGADVRALCTEAAMGPIRSCIDIRNIDADSVRPINLQDCEEALRGVRSSVATKDLDFYKQWNDEFGSFAFTGHEG